jgi:hypothetical protein
LIYLLGNILAHNRVLLQRFDAVHAGHTAAADEKHRSWAGFTHPVSHVKHCVVKN